MTPERKESAVAQLHGRRAEDNQTVFDRHITVGNIITLVVLLVTGLAGYMRLLARVDDLFRELEEHKTQQMQDAAAYQRRDVQEVRNRFIDLKLEQIESKVDSVLNHLRNGDAVKPGTSKLHQR